MSTSKLANDLKNRVKEQEVQHLSDDLKRKISELHLKIKSGTLSEAELAMTWAELDKLKAKIETRMVRASTQSQHS